ncbi:hypothetical protein CCAX7_63990 [Capsulimonas corticalis]|uniref:Uncharacterized protein n=1 Tax=Capsulimonas corticalis TaxID=2219043 RepID=A0A402CX51_9BACT|nr:hypothetical protein [Capsulimonas corticalis]BDI34348.1 hypothetical protein CCAX7_63990 [Capsulimonas corticalis]
MHRRYSLFAALTTSFGLILGSPAIASTTINDGAPTGFWNRLGPTVFGTVFTTPTHDTVLSDYTVYANTIPFQAGYQVRTDIFAWSGTSATGPLLFQSGVFTVPPSFSLEFPQNYIDLKANTGGLTLVAGQQYIALASTGPDLSPDVYGGFGVSSTTPYSPNNYGVYALYNPGNTIAGIVDNNAWQQLPSTPAFLAHFNAPAVPEPSGLAAIAASFLLLGAMTGRARFKRRL